MKLSAPVNVLKRRARRLSRDEGILLAKALDRVAADEGYARWSLLAASIAASPGPHDVYAALRPGELLLLAARPGQGKTLMSLKLAVEAIGAGRQAFFFTLDYSRRDVAERLAGMGADLAAFGDRFVLDCSDDISADHVATRLAGIVRAPFVVIDYLQLLDQKRDNPPLMQQVETLRALARRRDATIVVLSQIDRRFDQEERSVPGPGDVRLPNPLDLGLFDRTCFLHRGAVRIGA
ncbi:DNA helicase [Oricola sp.]|uniref:DNA helicase n=1 Tax=Oricola sp. TaxID=1979950 RepID=UPI003BACD06F